MSSTYYMNAIGAVYNFDGMIYVACKTLKMEFVPDDRRGDGSSIVDRVTQPRWRDNRFPHIPYILKHPRFVGPIFEMLSEQHANTIIPAGKYWCLAKSVQKNWYELEQTLLHISAHLFRNAPNQFMWTLEYESFPPPSKFGYLKLYDNARFARKKAMKSRNAFLPLMAMVSNGIAAYGPLTDANKLPQWMSVLHKANIHAAWVEALQQSQVAKFEAESRVGVFVNPGHTTELSGPITKAEITAYLQANIPVWIMLGRKENYAKFRDHVIGATFPLAPEALINAKPYPPIADAPEPEHGSRQHKGEDWKSFFSRLDEVQNRWSLTASEVERQRWMDKLRNGPGKRSKVYVWEEEGGFLMRNRVATYLVDSKCDEFNRDQMRYDPVKDEWDLCAALHPTPAYASLEDEEDDFIAAEGVESVKANGPDTNPAHFTPNTTNQLAKSYDEIKTGEQLGHIESLETIMYARFGFMWSGRPYEMCIQFTEDKWKEARKNLSDTRTPWTEEISRPHIIQFVKHMLEKENSPHEINTLNPHHPYSLRTHFNPQIRIQRHTFPNGEANIWFQIIVVGDYSASWDVAVRDPTTALECLRREWNSTYEIALELSKRGIPFSTRRRVQLAVYEPLPSIPQADIVGWRRADHIVDHRDYDVYIQTRDEFLRGPRGRAAILKGGIIWRLAREALGADIVLDGPSEMAKTWGSALRFSEPGEIWLDDELSDFELDFICGTYKMFTGEGAVPQRESWWPRPNAWEGSGLNVGYWSHTCEEWYQRRVAEIRSSHTDRGMIRTSTHWKKAMLLNKKARKFAQNVRESAGNYLQSVCM